MGFKNIFIHVPCKNESIENTHKKWVNEFASIFKIAIKKGLQEDVNVTLNMTHKSATEVHKKIESSDIIVLLLIDEKLEINELDFYNNTQSIKNKVIIQLNVNPAFCNFYFDTQVDVSVINLYNNSLKKLPDFSIQENHLWLKIQDILYKIKNALNKQQEQKEEKQKIFVAQTSHDQNQNRENIIRELEHLGYDVLPSSEFPGMLIPFTNMVSENLQKSFLSIHILGEDYQPLIKNMEIAGIEIQNDLFIEAASEKNKKGETIQRLIWIPPLLKYKSDKQFQYINSLKNNVELLKNTEIIETPLETFKTIIKNTLNTEKNSKKDKQSKTEKSVSIYIISDNNLGLLHKETREFIQNNGFQLLETKENTNKLNQVKEHYQNLVQCDAVIITYTNNNEQWLNSKLKDMLKSLGFGRKKNFAARAIITNSQNKINMDNIFDDLMIVNGNASNIYQDLSSIIEKIG